VANLSNLTILYGFLRCLLARFLTVGRFLSEDNGEKDEKKGIMNVAAVALAAALEPIFYASIAPVDVGVGVCYGQSGRH